MRNQPKAVAKNILIDSALIFFSQRAYLFAHSASPAILPPLSPLSTFLPLPLNLPSALNSMVNRAEPLPRRFLDPLRTDPDAAAAADQVLANVSMLPNRSRQQSELDDPQRYLGLPAFYLSRPFFHIGDVLLARTERE